MLEKKRSTCLRRPSTLLFPSICLPLLFFPSTALLPSLPFPKLQETGGMEEAMYGAAAALPLPKLHETGGMEEATEGVAAVAGFVGKSVYFVHTLLNLVQ